ncbi:conjugative transfer signal peptidase TraF [Phyllobacterium zundukense]|uniref:Conjugative transfer signal peptidase TraF n=1 Tax=Phyllobacterium zundukense TaxID=1867719 RepID=A0A2N9VUL4_9HYPH|nr:conjugative transfer signal peptidase TraF [Phyllobacterium zundukense]ATU95358.1 conjugative transfer signal peptidase TraF [Phyllobacterium zundukense]PIO43182.1 conjugative transfer signal peptidase TraF [Phyllobacterium zundukense]
MKARGILVALVAAGIVMSGVAIIGFFGGYRLNLTPSEPLGLWRIVQLDRPVRTGDLVFICLPPTEQFRQALTRGYLRRGLCDGGVAPLIKTVAALPGQRVEIGADVVIDGQSLPNLRLRHTDGDGRAIAPFAGGIVPPGYLYLHSSFESSYDSRYFGPVPDAGLLGLAWPVFTFGP